MIKFLLAMLLAFVSFNSHAETIRVMESVQGETKTEFVTRVATFIHGWTDKWGFEACGYITTFQGSLYVVVETNRDTHYCNSTTMVKGSTYSGETIHSHPSRKFGASKSRRKSANWSALDYETPGYLVENGWLFYQNGKGTESVIGNVKH